VVAGCHEIPIFDPFLLLDDFSSDNPKDYLAGFPWHPHRGIETVTYMIEGEVEHQDSLGNKDTIRTGEVQWMRAGRGILHQEMPKKSKKLTGIQLWVNLAKKDKMSAPGYHTIKPKNGIISEGEIIYRDMETDNFSFHRPGYNSFIYILEGSGKVNGKEVKARACVHIGEEKLQTKGAMRFLLISGKPLKEPIAWGGPIVMNTQEELQAAFRELDEGSFIKQ